MRTAFDVSVVNRNGRAIVFVNGELDLTTAAQFREALRTAQHGSPDVIVDLSRVTFMDTTGISALVGARRMVPAGQFHVVGATKQIRKVFKITGVDRYLSENDGRTTLYRSVDDAIKTLDG
jgi:anti-sigma B factor antagonist